MKKLLSHLDKLQYVLFWVVVWVAITIASRPKLIPGSTDKEYDSLNLVFLILWFVTILLARSEGRVAIVLALILLIQLVITMIFNDLFPLPNDFRLQQYFYNYSDLAEQIAILVYLSLVVGTIHMILEETKFTKPKVKYREFYKQQLITASAILINLAKILIKVLINCLRWHLDLIIKIFRIISYGTPKNKLQWAIKITQLAFAMGIIAGIYGLFIYDGLIIKDIVLLQERIARRQSFEPQINFYQPQIAYSGMKVIVRGKDFGCGQKENHHFLSNYGKLDIISHECDKIIFRIPYDWPTDKKFSFWVKKLISWEGYNFYVKSNKAEIKLLSISQEIRPEDEKFFEHMKQVDPEVLEVNQYRR